MDTKGERKVCRILSGENLAVSVELFFSDDIVENVGDEFWYMRGWPKEKVQSFCTSFGFDLKWEN
jgi:hypothetical protein